MKLTLLDTKTLKTVEVDDDISAYQWAENNWSDDCNRISYFDEVDEEEYHREVKEQMIQQKPELKKDNFFMANDSICLGARRFLIIAPELIQDEDNCYTLREVNERYPSELLDKYLPKSK